MSGTWLAVLIGLPLFFAQPALAQDADAVRKAVSDAGLQVEQLEERYLRQPLMERDHAVTARISDGQLFHLTRDYERAAMVLLDVVRRPGIEEHPGYREVLYYLGDSLFHLRNFRAAAEWYEVLTQRGNIEQRQLALGRLIEIAVATRNEAAAQSLLDRAGPKAWRFDFHWSGHDPCFTSSRRRWHHCDCSGIDRRACRYRHTDDRSPLRYRSSIRTGRTAGVHLPRPRAAEAQYRR